jgi:hypothetical protein
MEGSCNRRERRATAETGREEERGNVPRTEDMAVTHGFASFLLGLRTRSTLTGGRRIGFLVILSAGRGLPFESLGASKQQAFPQLNCRPLGEVVVLGLALNRSLVCSSIACRSNCASSPSNRLSVFSTTPASLLRRAPVQKI